MEGVERAGVSAVEAADGGVETTVEAGAGEPVMETGGEGVGAEGGDVQGEEAELIIEIEGLLNQQQTLWRSWVSFPYAWSFVVDASSPFYPSLFVAYRVYGMSKLSPLLGDQDTNREHSYTPLTRFFSLSVRNAGTQAQESTVGITHFISEDVPSFSGILKQRFSDFIVHEVHHLLVWLSPLPYQKPYPNAAMGSYTPNCATKNHWSFHPRGCFNVPLCCLHQIYRPNHAFIYLYRVALANALIP